jgi:hypothetical protein
VKAITLWQPWASLVAVGAKRLETRSWATSYRGPIAIHASKTSPSGARTLAETEPFWTELRKERFHQYNLPAGAVIATARLVACCEVAELAEKRVILAPVGEVDHLSEGMLALLGATPSRPIPALERAFGDFKPGRFAWVLEDVVRLPEPIPARGHQGLWEWDQYAEPVSAEPAAIAPLSSPGVPPPLPASPAPPPSANPAMEAAAGLVVHADDLIERMAQLAAGDVRMRSGFTDCRQRFLRSFARDVLAAVLAAHDQEKAR